MKKDTRSRIAKRPLILTTSSSFYGTPASHESRIKMEYRFTRSKRAFRRISLVSGRCAWSNQKSYSSKQSEYCLRYSEQCVLFQTYYPRLFGRYVLSVYRELLVLSFKITSINTSDAC